MRGEAVNHQLTPFGERLVQALIDVNMSDSDLAKRLGIAQPNIHTLKYKTVRPRVKTVTAIAKALKVPRETLLTPPLPTNLSGTKIYLVIEIGKNKSTVRLA